MKNLSSSLPFQLFCYSILLLILVSGCNNAELKSDNSAENSSQVHPVEVEQIAPTTKPLPVVASGVLASKSEINLSFKIGGYIDKILVEESDNVKKGDVLARLDQSEINAQVTKAKNTFLKAKRDLKRVRNLYQDTVATLEQVQDLETAYEVAQAELKIAYYDQDNATILAPADGQILNKFAEKEEQVKAGSPLLRLGTFGGGSQIIKLGIADRDVIHVQPGDSAHIRFDALPDSNFKGEVTMLAAAADPRTGIFEIEIVLSKHNKELRNGFVGKATIFPTGQSSYLRIPMGALVEGNAEEAFIYVPTDSMQTAQRVRVKPIYIGESFFAISASELKKYSQVITRGTAYLGPGSKINIVNKER